MGYDLHITRAQEWFDTAGHEIAAEEWLALVDAEPDLAPAPEVGGPYFAVWVGRDAWLSWSDGQVFTKNPDRALLARMVQIAARLDARIQGDEGEFYTGGEPMYDDFARPERPWWRRLLGR